MFLSKVIFNVFLVPVVFACYNDDKCCRLTGGSPVLTNANCLSTSRNGTLEWTVNLSNNSLGRMDVTFPLFDIYCETLYYHVKLVVYEDRTEETCHTDLHPLDHGGEIHSKRKYYILRPDQEDVHTCPDTCGEVASMRFQYVFTGCYQLVVFRQLTSGSTTMHLYFNAKYFYTDYSKQLIANEKPTIRHQNPGQESTITFRVKQHVASTYTIGLKNSTWNCVHCNNTACECTSKSASHQFQCSITESNTVFTFNELPAGYYCATIVMTDDRCVDDTIWMPPGPYRGSCQWYYPFTVQPVQVAGSLKPTDVNSNQIYIILGVVCAVIVAAIIIALLFMKSYIIKLRSRTTLPPLPSSMIPLEPSRIFLLYARDCQAFMTLMATFREVLEDTTKCEVIDCLDASRWNEIGRSPVDWVRGHIEHLNTKVVLVATPCAYLRQQALLQQVTSHYKEPGSYDNLFIYGLKALTENLTFDVYRKVSVVRFEGFSDERESLFNHLTPYTRFMLPLHLHKLVANLRLSASPEQNDQLIENKEVQKLSQDLTQLINYKNNNIRYLQDMLLIQRNEVNC